MRLADSVAAPPPRGIGQVLATGAGRLLVSIFVPVVAFIVLWAGFLFLKDSGAPKIVIVLVAIVWGIGGVALLYVVANWLTEKLPPAWQRRILPFVFVGPAIAILTFYLLVPAFLTAWESLFNATGSKFVGLDNYVYSFSNPEMVTAIRNNVLWLVFGTLFSTGLGLAIAVLVERSRLDRLAKTLIFLPMAISFVGASVIWRFVLSFQPAGQPQVGLLNAILSGFGIGPVSWLTGEPLNTILLIVILIWGQTGFAMVIIGAALKGVPDEMLEAGRIDGASEWQVFRRLIVPTIWPTIVTVATTIAILTLKIYDIVTAMTGGNFNTQVIATLMWKQAFTFFDAGRGAALAIILLVAVTPVIWYNLRQFRGRAI
ncbi:MAG: sugar ABC transporter permease [Candidatus Limnocylindrales bacterium]|jgi:alpha-glucoside transport system permease protein|nr:sugar ABC transporter permease [Candidatus Limnocylindrales bacterium]